MLAWVGSLAGSQSEFLDAECRVSLYPSCHGNSQTALLRFPNPPTFFHDIIKNGRRKYEQYKYTNQTSELTEEVLLSIDSDFYDLTPLNTPSEYIFAEWAPSYYTVKTADESVQRHSSYQAMALAHGKVVIHR
jgi:hypothetical protein